MYALILEIFVLILFLFKSFLNKLCLSLCLYLCLCSAAKVSKYAPLSSIAFIAKQCVPIDFYSSRFTTYVRSLFKSIFSWINTIKVMIIFIIFLYFKNSSIEMFRMGQTKKPLNQFFSSNFYKCRNFPIKLSNF